MPDRHCRTMSATLPPDERRRFCRTASDGLARPSVRRLERNLRYDSYVLADAGEDPACALAGRAGMAAYGAVREFARLDDRSDPVWRPHFRTPVQFSYELFRDHDERRPGNLDSSRAAH